MSFYLEVRGCLRIKPSIGRMRGFWKFIAFLLYLCDQFRTFPLVSGMVKQTVQAISNRAIR